MRLIVHTLMIVLLSGALARGQQATVRIAFDQGRVTLTATDALVSDVLAEWERVGGTYITGAEYLLPAKITLELVAVDEWGALEELIGSGNGILAAKRANAPAGISRLARVAITPLPDVANPNVANGPTPTREIDGTMPESRFEYPAPVVEIVPDDAETIALQAQGPPILSTDPSLMPEMRFQYADAWPAVPQVTDDAQPDDTAQKQPETDR